MIIKEANVNEYEIIAGFQLKMAKETENISLDKQTVEKGVKSVFNDPSKGCYYVAEYDGKIIASLLTTFEWSDWRNSSILWIQSVFVIPEFRNKKVFKHMFEYIKEKVKTDSTYGGIRLYVDKSNTIAQKVYTNIGMNGEHYQVYEWMLE